MMIRPYSKATLSYWFGLFVLITAGLFVCDMWVFDAFAENRFGFLRGYNAGGEPSQCSNSTYAVPQVIECIKYSLINATYNMMYQIETYLRYPMMAFLTLAVIHLGVQMISQEKQMQQKALILLFKAGFVFMMTNNFGGLIPWVFAIMDEGQMIVSSGLYTGEYVDAVLGSDEGVGCPNMSSFFTEGDLWIFAHLSCVLGQLFGYGPDVIVSGSLFGLLAAFIGGGALGVTIFFEGIIALVSVVMLVLRAIYYYISAYFMVSFAIILAPIFLPMLFMKQTINYFNKWLGFLQAAMINPMIVTAYIVLAMMMIDAVMFSRPDSLANVLNPEALEGCLRETQVRGQTILNDPNVTSRMGAVDMSYLEEDGILNRVFPGLSGSAGILEMMLGEVVVPEIDCYDDPATDENEHLEILGGIFLGVLKVLLIVWLLKQVMETVAVMATQLTNSGYRLNTFVTSTFQSDFSHKVTGGIDTMRTTMMNEAGDSWPGPDGVSGFVGSFDDGMSSLIGAMTGRRS